MGKIGRKCRARKSPSSYIRTKARNSAIKKAIKGLKGKRFTDRFVCDLCRHTQLTGYLYTTEDQEYEICKFCYDALNDIRPHVKVIYTPMGNKR